MKPRATYNLMKRSLENALHDMCILSGEIIGPSDVSWQDVAGTAATNFQVLANQLLEARAGNHESFITFPSPYEALDKEKRI